MPSSRRHLLTALILLVVMALGAPPAAAGATPSTPTATTPGPTESGSSDWRTITVGVAHSCGIRTNGRLFCWGDDDGGQLGDGANLRDQPAPVEVRGNRTDWVTVAAGAGHTCGRVRSGRLYCWGRDLFGQLGDGGANTARAVPGEVAGGRTDWTTVSAGGNTTCARRTTGRLFCWGEDSFGQLGDGGANAPSGTPRQVRGNRTDWVQVSVGDSHVCARRASRRLFCWGADGLGQLGDGGANTARPTPTEVSGATADWTTVSAGALSTCGRRTTGRLYCWGTNNFGQLGDGTNTDRSAPTQVRGNRTDWSAVTVGANHACARRRTGRLFCWGGDSTGQLGNGAPAAVTVLPVEVVDGATDWRTIDAGGTHTCATISSRRVFCWGADDSGQLGNDTDTGNRFVPDGVSGNTGLWVTVSSGVAHTCGIRRSGRLYCWGDDFYGQLGDSGANNDQVVPTEVGGGFTDWTTVSAGSNHTCARRSNGRLYCWGRDLFGQLGDGGANSDQTQPVLVSGFLDWTAVTTGGNHTCALRATRQLYCWGDDSTGQLGDVAVGAQGVPVEVAGGRTDWRAVTAGGFHTCARTAGSRLLCWGADGNGQLGDDAALAPRTTPTEVAGARTDWRAVTAGLNHTCGLRRTGRLFCWGDGFSGQLGIGGLGINRAVPAQVTGARTDWVAVSAGGSESCARRRTGDLLCWGDDATGQLGDDGVLADQDVPVPVAGGFVDWSLVDVGGNQVCVRLVNGLLTCWGQDASGQLGDGGANTNQPLPVFVAG